MDWFRTWGHVRTSYKSHLVWCTKYRYRVLKWDIKVRCRDLIKQICEFLDITILKWVISEDHVHIVIEYPPKLDISNIVKRLKWKTSRKLQQEFPELKKRYRWKHFRAIWYFWASTWNVNESIILQYLEHHQDEKKNIREDNTFILEGQ